MESKKDIRKCALAKRNCISKQEWEEKSRLICEKVVTHPFFLDSDVIYCYVDYRNEVCTRGIIETAWKQDKKVAVPKVIGDEMEFHYIQSCEDLKEGYRGIPEPWKNNPACDTGYVLIIMPGAAFDIMCNRIGYGKGYYDKYLHAHPNYKTLALAFEFQMVEHIPSGEYDICPNMIITEENTYERQLTK